MQESRRFVRWQVNRQARVKLEGAQAGVPCTIHDINFTGAKISLAQKLAPDVFFKLKISLAEGFDIEVEAWLVWRKTVEGVNVYGLYFSKVPDKDKEKIYQFVRRHFPKEMHKRFFAEPEQEKGGEQMEDRRIFARFPTKLPLKYLDTKSGREGVAQTCDISAKGIGLVTDSELPPRAPLEMWLKISDKTEPLYTRGEVVWSRPESANEYRAGVNLEKADLMALSRVLRAA